MANGELSVSDAGVNLESAAGTKLAYQSPTLTVYGSVRELTGGQSGTGTDGASGMSNAKTSDPSAKENAVRIGMHPAGFGIYLFDYKAELRAEHLQVVEELNGFGVVHVVSALRH